MHPSSTFLSWTTSLLDAHSSRPTSKTPILLFPSQTTHSCLLRRSPAYSSPLSDSPPFIFICLSLSLHQTCWIAIPSLLPTLLAWPSPFSFPFILLKLWVVEHISLIGCWLRRLVFLVIARQAALMPHHILWYCPHAVMLESLCS